jgi:ATP-binding cassette, subfamily B, bacterial PglK
MQFESKLIYLKKILIILGDSKKKIPWMILLFLMLSLLDILGIGLIAPYMVMIINPDAFLASDIGVFLSSNLNLKIPNLMLLAGGILILVFFIKTVVGIFVSYSILKFCTNQTYKIRSLLMKNYQSMDYEQFTRRNSSEYIHNIQIVADKFSVGVLQSILRATSEVIVIIVILLFLAWNSIEIVILLFAILGSVVLVYDLVYGKKIKKYGVLSNKYSTHMVKGLNEGISGFKEVRVLGKKDYFYQVVSSEAKNHAYSHLKSSHISLIPRYLLELILVFFIVLSVNIFVFIDKDASYFLSTLSMFGIAAVRLAPSVNRVMSGISMIRFGRNFVDIIYNDIGKRSYEDDNSISKNIQTKPQAFSLLKLDNVTFSYLVSDDYAIKDVSLEIKAGESIGIIGPSGSGKTSLIDLIIGFLNPSSGRILVNGEPIDKDISKWLALLAYIPQEVFLLDDTLESNIAIGDKDNIDRNRMNEAIKQSRLEGVIAGLKYGINTVIGEKGVQLSGGQRQRVALARAFYHQREVLIMDEATSALDNETEQEIVSEIKRLKGLRTLIVIAHRLTTLQYCDRIYRLKGGKISEQLKYNDII